MDVRLFGFCNLLFLLFFLFRLLGLFLDGFRFLFGLFLFDHLGLGIGLGFFKGVDEGLCGRLVGEVSGHITEDIGYICRAGVIIVNDEFFGFRGKLPVNALERVTGHIVADVGDLELVIDVWRLDGSHCRVGYRKGIARIKRELAGENVDRGKGVHLRANSEDAEEIVNVIRGHADLVGSAEAELHRSLYGVVRHGRHADAHATLGCTHAAATGEFDIGINEGIRQD